MLILVPKQVDDCCDLPGLEKFLMVRHRKHPDKSAPIAILKHPIHIEKLHIHTLHGGLGVFEIRVPQLLLNQLLVDLHGRFDNEVALCFGIFHGFLVLSFFVVFRRAGMLLNLIFSDEL